MSAADLSNMGVASAEQPATLVNILGIKVIGSARIDLSAGGWQSVPFDGSEIAAHATKTVNASGVVTGLTTSLVSSLDLTLTIGGLSAPLSPIVGLVKPVLAAAAPLLDPVVQSLLDTLGIHLGQADVRIDGVRCGTAALVA